MNLNSTHIVYISILLILALWLILKRRLFGSKKKRLIKLLDKAENLVAKYSGGYSGNFLSAEESHLELQNAIMDFKDGDTAKLDLFYYWFAPTCAWDDFVGRDGESLGNEIFALITKLKSK